LSITEENKTEHLLFDLISRFPEFEEFVRIKSIACEKIETDCGKKDVVFPLYI